MWTFIGVCATKKALKHPTLVQRVGESNYSGPRCRAVHDGALRAPIVRGAARRRRVTKKQKNLVAN